MDRLRAQLVPESVVVVVLMTGFLMVMYLVNQSLGAQSAALKGQLQASTAANQMASAINRVAAAGDGAQVSFFNYAGTSVTGMSIYEGRSLHAMYSGSYVSVPLATNKTLVVGGGNITINRPVVVKNVNGTISIQSM